MKRFLQNLPLKIKIGLIVLLPMCGYLVTTGINLHSTYSQYQSAQTVVTLVTFDGMISQLVHELQKERGSSSGYIASKGQKFTDILANQRTATDEKITPYQVELAEVKRQISDTAITDKINQAGTSISAMANMRQKVSTLQVEPKVAISYYSSLIAELLDLTSAISHLSDDPGITAQMFSYVNFLQSKERSGIERATLSAVFSKGAFTSETYSRFLQLLAGQENYLAMFRTQAQPEARKLYDATVKGTAVDEVERMRQVALSVGLDSSKSFGVDAEVWFKTITEKINLLKSVDDDLAKGIIHDATTKTKVMRDRLLSITIMFIAIFAASLTLMVTTSLSLIKGINKANRIALDLAEGDGDLTKRMGFKAKDEIGRLGRSIDTLLTSLGGMVGQIKESGGKLNHSGQELAALAEQMNGATANIQTRANGVAASAEEMNINMNSVAAAVEQAALNITTVANSTGEVASAGKDIADSTKNALVMTSEAVTYSKRSYEMISTLGEAAQEIGRVTETISEISEQTNLLALNATIEAARAGDAGKGFAVVANEIKELAKQTAGATVEINAKIRGIQEYTGHSVDEIQKILEVINNVDSVVNGMATAINHQTTATNDIAQNIEQASIGLQEVANNVSQISAVSGEVAKDIADVSYSSQELTSSSNSVKQSAVDLSNLTANIHSVIGRFTV